MLYLHCSDAAMALQFVQNGSLSPKKATVLCLNHESLHTSTRITNLWAWFVGVGSNMTRVCGRGRWVWPWSRKGLRKSWSLCTIDYYQDRPDGEQWDAMSLATFATHYNVVGTENGSHPKLKTFDKWVKKRQKPACLRKPPLTQTSGDEYYSLRVLFKPFRNESMDLVKDGESPRDAFLR